MTLLGTASNVIIFEEVLMAPDNIKSVCKMVDMLVVEFNQQVFEEYISSGSAIRMTSRPPEMVGIESLAHTQPSLNRVGEAGAISQGAQGTPPPSHNFPQLVGGGSTSSCDATKMEKVFNGNVNNVNLLR